MEFLSQYYFTIKALHLIAVIAWMVGLLYLPRLFVYHCQAKVGSEMYKTFLIMEYRLLRIIMNPAMIAVFILGLALVLIDGLSSLSGWFHAKLLLVLGLVIIHAMLSRYRKDFEKNQNRKSATYFRILNEVPAVFMAFIVIFAVAKPF